MTASLRVAAAILASMSVSGARGQAVRPAAPNVVRVTMRTPHGGFNRLVVNLTVCAPGTDRCATIDDIMLDTGSTGLRLETSAVPPDLRLPTFPGPHGLPLAECLRFVADDAWGPLYRADMTLGGMTAADLPIQIIGDAPEAQPDSCPRSDVQPTANGTLGIGPQLTDCAGACEQNPAQPGVFECTADRCLPVPGRVAPAYRLPNPVTRLPEHNTGVVIDLPPAPPGGTDAVVGTLTLGVGTSDNNRLGPAAVVRLDGAGRFTTLYEGMAYPDSYLDSGTETYIVPDARLPRCSALPWAFCVSPERTLQAAMVGLDRSPVPTAFRIGDYATIRQHRFGAADSLAVAAGPGSKTFVWGAPFFLGKRVSVLIDGKDVQGVSGPAYAYRAHEP